MRITSLTLPLLYLLDARCCICEKSVFTLSLCSSCSFSPLKRIPHQSSRFASEFVFEQKAQKLLHQIKYLKKYELLSLLKPYLPSTFPWNLDSPTTLIPVPLSKQRFFERGFNQAEWLAHQLSIKTLIPWENQALKKSRNTIPQSLLSKKERQSNLRNAFFWDPKVKIPEQVVLIDDVLTTGGTLKECEKVLRANGTKKVFGWTLFKKGISNEEIAGENIPKLKANPDGPLHTD